MAQRCQSALPDCHLVRTAILFLPRKDSLGDFHYSLSVSLASFAETVSESRGPPCSGRERKRPDLSFTNPHARQATSAHSVTARDGRCTALQVHHLLRTQLGNTTMGVRLCTRTGLHGNRVGITMPLESALSPQARGNALPPSTHPKLGVSSRHHGFHRCALQRIFRPSLGNGRSD